MDLNSAKYIADKSKGEKLKFIFDTLNKDKKRFEKISLVRSLSPEEANEFEEICTKLKSFHSKCNIFIKSRKNGPGKFMVDLYMNYCNTQQTPNNTQPQQSPDDKSNFPRLEINQHNHPMESNNAHESKYSKVNIDSQPTGDLNTNKKQEVNKIQPQQVKTTNIPQFHQNPGHFQSPMAASPHQFLGSPNVQPYPGHSLYHQPNLTQQYQQNGSPHQFARAPMPPHIRTNLAYKTLDIEPKNTPMHSSNFRFEDNSYMNQEQPPLYPMDDPSNNQQNLNQPKPQPIPHQMYKESGQQHNNQYLFRDNGQQYNQQLYREGGQHHNQQIYREGLLPHNQQVYRDNNVNNYQMNRDVPINSPHDGRNNQFGQPMIVRKHMPRADFRPNSYDPRATNSELYRNSHPQPMYRGGNQQEFRKEPVLSLDDIIPIGAQDVDMSPKGIVDIASNRINPGMMNTNNKVKSPKSRQRPIIENTVFPQFSPPNSVIQQRYGPSKKKYASYPQEISPDNSYRNNLTGNVNIQRAAFANEHTQNYRNNITEQHQFPGQSAVLRPPPRELYNNIQPTLPVQKIAGNKPIHGDPAAPVNIIKAARRTVRVEPQIAVNDSVELANSVPQEFIAKKENNCSELVTFVTKAEECPSSGFLVNVGSVLSTKPKSDITVLERSPIASCPNASKCYSQMDATLHKTLIIGCMLASSRKSGSGLSPKDIEIAFKKATECNTNK